jgi:hypothetical protein
MPFPHHSLALLQIRSEGPSARIRLPQLLVIQHQLIDLLRSECAAGRLPGIRMSIVASKNFAILQDGGLQSAAFCTQDKNGPKQGRLLSGAEMINDSQ